MRKKQLLPLVAAMCFFLGFETAGYQTTVLSVSREYQVDSAMMGLMIAAQYIAIMLMPLIFGRLSDSIGKKKVLLIAMPMFLTGCLIAACSRSALVFTAGVFVIGGGFSICECVSSAALVDAAPDKADRSLNITQLLFSLGAVAGPLITQWLMDRGVSWRAPFFICAGAYLILFLLFWFTETPVPAIMAPREENGSVKRVLFRKGFLLLAVAMILYVGLENGIVYFAEAMFAQELAAPAMGSYAISAFWLCMAGSRLVFGLFRYSAAKVLLSCQLLICAALAALILVKTPYFALALFGFAGACAGPTWPLIFSMASRAVPEHTGAASSILSFSCGLGGALSPIALGFISQSAGMKNTYLLLIIMGLCGFIAVFIRNRKHGKQTRL